MIDVAAICAEHGVEPEAIRDVRGRGKLPAKIARDAVVRAAIGAGQSTRQMAEMLRLPRTTISAARRAIVRTAEERTNVSTLPLASRVEGAPCTSLLVRDERPDRRPGHPKGPIFRRRADCARLRACETGWIDAHGGEQARCPTACRGYVPRTTEAR